MSCQLVHPAISHELRASHAALALRLDFRYSRLVFAQGEPSMHPFIKFFIRAVLGLAFAVLITRMFRGSVQLDYAAGLAAVLVAIAYVFEWLRKRK